ncbi:MAG: ATP-dependent RNA helicase HrpA, partial [Thermodesulfobacteriota bacterium]|nr:ATP-dependent RNA helicase HrpA [Thermodesulfobacteriota bacterium]
MKQKYVQCSQKDAESASHNNRADFSDKSFSHGNKSFCDKGRGHDKDWSRDKNVYFDKRIAKLDKRVQFSLEKRKKRLSNLPQIKYNPELPIFLKKDEIVNALKKNRVVIISGETGSGKTTQIPKFCIEAGRGVAGKIGCTQPRRIAAITVAARIAEELGEETGRSVGYKIRFDDRSAADSFIRIMTDGILLAETQKDPYLNEYDTIIVDEAHERSLNIDFTLGILRNLVKKRDDLKLIITSATIDTEKFSLAFDMAPVIEVSGRTFPVEVRYSVEEEEEEKEREGDNSNDSQSLGDDQGYVEAAADALDMICRESRSGDILIFMPTEQDIEETMELIRGRGRHGLNIMPLFARLSAREQARVFSRGPGRKVIVATNVAETSLTIPGIKYVIDSGLARIPNYSPRTRTTALPVKAISQSSADQRKGRCGRVANGICIRLYSEEDYGSRPFFTSPEILRSNLAEVILRMISLKLGDVSSFPFIDAPLTKSIKDGFDTLLELNAIKEKYGTGKGKKSKNKKKYILTKKGRIMAGIPVDPKLSRILIEANLRGCLNEALVIASALSIADPRQRPHDKARQADQKHAQFRDVTSDFVTLLNIWKACSKAEKSLKSRGRIRKFCKDNFLSFKRIREWKDIHRQIGSVLKEHGISSKPGMTLTRTAPAAHIVSAAHTAAQTTQGSTQTAPGSTQTTQGPRAKEYEIGGELYIELHKSILCGYLANIAHKKEKHIFNAAKGQKALIFPGSGLFKNPGAWIVAAEYVKTTQLFARCAANIDPAWLEELGKDLCTYTWSDPHWEKKRGEVVAKEQVSLFGLVIVPSRSVSYGRINKNEACEIFIRDALVQGEVVRNFPFMDHNQALIDQLTRIEDKTRKRDILVTEEDIFLFYQKRIEHDFSDLRSFAKYLKDKKDDSFLKMTLGDIQKNAPDEDELANFPDYLDMGGVKLNLEYDFKPGHEKDGVTVKVPAVSAGLVAKESVERLIPGLFKEKVEALIKNLSKEHRKKLLPVSHKADIISKEMRDRGRPLFSEMSFFVKQRFNIDIPASAWSDSKIEDHLKMRISIRDNRDNEIAFSRKSSLLKDFSHKTFNGDAFEDAKKRLEKENIKTWDFGDIQEPVKIKENNDLSYDLAYDIFYGLLKDENGGGLSLRLFRSKESSLKAHKTGVAALYEISFERDFSALKKDLKSSKELKQYASLFGPRGEFLKSLLNCMLKDIFAKNIRTKREFYDYADKTMPLLYKKGASFIQAVVILCDEYQKTLTELKNISLKNRNRIYLLTLLEQLEKDMISLVPGNFPDIYNPARIGKISTYVQGIRIRAERAAVESLKDEKKSELVAKYRRKLENMLKELNENSSWEKSETIEEFFWMIEEYKISLFAQELKTSIKISPE